MNQADLKGGVWWANPVTLAIYAKKHGLLDTLGWKMPGFKKIAEMQDFIVASVMQTKLQSFLMKPVYMYGFLVPCNHEQAMQLDRGNGNTKWSDAKLLELAQIDEYQSFLDKGPKYLPEGYMKITDHFMYAVKHDRRHKVQFIAWVHLNETPIDSIYSSVISL